MSILEKYVVNLRGLFNIKYARNANIEKFKLRFVETGFSQREGVDYEDTFTPVIKYDSIWVVISIA